MLGSEEELFYMKLERILFQSFMCSPNPCYFSGNIGFCVHLLKIHEADHTTDILHTAALFYFGKYKLHRKDF